MSDIESKDLISYGMIPEFVGRLPVVVPFQPLKEQDLVRILTQPKNALVPQYKHLFGMDNIILTFSQEALAAIAKLAKQKQTGN